MPFIFIILLSGFLGSHAIASTDGCVFSNIKNQTEVLRQVVCETNRFANWDAFFSGSIWNFDKDSKTKLLKKLKEHQTTLSKVNQVDEGTIDLGSGLRLYVENLAERKFRINDTVIAFTEKQRFRDRFKMVSEAILKEGRHKKQSAFIHWILPSAFGQERLFSTPERLIHDAGAVLELVPDNIYIYGLASLPFQTVYMIESAIGYSDAFLLKPNCDNQIQDIKKIMEEKRIAIAALSCGTGAYGGLGLYMWDYDDKGRVIKTEYMINDRYRLITTSGSFRGYDIREKMRTGEMAPDEDVLYYFGPWGYELKDWGPLAPIRVSMIDEKTGTQPRVDLFEKDERFKKYADKLKKSGVVELAKYFGANRTCLRCSRVGYQPLKDHLETWKPPEYIKPSDTKVQSREATQ